MISSALPLLHTLPHPQKGLCLPSSPQDGSDEIREELEEPDSDWDGRELQGVQRESSDNPPLQTRRGSSGDAEITHQSVFEVSACT